MVELYPHQLEASEKLSNGRILCGGVGVGKSITAVHYYMVKESPRDVYVITTAKKRDSLDWEGEFAKFGIGGAKDATVGGVLTVDSWNQIGKYVNVVGAFFIFDEQRLVGSGVWTKKFLKIARRNHWILLSATPGDSWMDYIPVFLANRFYENRTQFKREHVVYNSFSKFPKIDRYVNVGKLIKFRKQLLVEMPYKRHTNMVCKTITTDYDTKLFERVYKQRWHVFETRPLKNSAELFSVMRKVVNTDSSRVTAIKSLMEEHPKLIVFYNFDYELEMLRELCTANSFGKCSKIYSINSIGTTGIEIKTDEFGNGVTISTPTSHAGSKSTLQSAALWTQQNNGLTSQKLLGISVPTDGMAESSSRKKLQKVHIAEWNGHKHQPIPQTDRWVYLVQYRSGAEGWNCVETNAICFYSLTYSYRDWHQAHGRINRLNTTYNDLYYYYLISNSVIDNAVWKALSNKKSFNESMFIRGKL